MHKNGLIPPVISFNLKASDINVLFAGVEGNYARLEVEPRYDARLFQPAIYIMKWNGNGWVQILVGSELPLDTLQSLKIPASLYADYTLKV